MKADIWVKQNPMALKTMDVGGKPADVLGETISYIAEYVNFPSQSYMGKVLKRSKGMTPQKYRDKYKPGEFGTR